MKKYTVSLYEDFSGIPWVLKSQSDLDYEKAFEYACSIIKSFGFLVIPQDIKISFSKGGEYNLTDDLTIVIDQDEE